MTAIYDLQEAARNIRHAKGNQSRKMTELLLPDLKPPSKMASLNKKSKDKIKSIERNFLMKQAQKRIEATSEYDTPSTLWKIQKFKEVQGKIDSLSAARNRSDHSPTPNQLSQEHFQAIREVAKGAHGQVYCERTEATEQPLMMTPHKPLRKNVHASDMHGYELPGLPEKGSSIASTGVRPRGLRPVLSKESLDKLNRISSNRSNLDNFLDQPTEGFERTPIRKHGHKSNLGVGSGFNHPQQREGIIMEENPVSIFNARASSLDATAPSIRRLHHPDALNRSVIQPLQPNLPRQSLDHYQNLPLVSSSNPSQAQLPQLYYPSQPYLGHQNLLRGLPPHQLSQGQRTALHEQPRFKQSSAVPPLPAQATPEPHFPTIESPMLAPQQYYYPPPLKTEENRFEGAISQHRSSANASDLRPLAQPKSMIYSQQKRKIIPTKLNLLAAQDESTKEETGSRSRNLLDRAPLTDNQQQSQPPGLGIGRPQRSEEERNQIITEFVERQKQRSLSKRNIIKENIVKAIQPKGKGLGQKEAEPVSGNVMSPLAANYAKVPKYLRKFQHQEEENEIHRMQIERMKDVPPGTRLVGELERVDLLVDLYSTRRDIKNQLERMPLRSPHALRARGIEEQAQYLEQQLVRVNNAVVQFENPPVYIKL